MNQLEAVACNRHHLILSLAGRAGPQPSCGILKIALKTRACPYSELSYPNLSIVVCQELRKSYHISQDLCTCAFDSLHLRLRFRMSQTPLPFLSHSLSQSVSPCVSILVLQQPESPPLPQRRAINFDRLIERQRCTSCTSLPRRSRHTKWRVDRHVGSALSHPPDATYPRAGNERRLWIYDLGGGYFACL